MSPNGVVSVYTDDKKYKGKKWIIITASLEDDASIKSNQVTLIVNFKI